MMLCEDVGLQDKVSLVLFTLVVRFSYKNKCKMSIEEWVSVCLNPLLGYSPDVFYLTKGWFGF